jgi:hypothetical protein
MPRLSSLTSKQLTILGVASIPVIETATILNMNLGSRSYNSNSFQIGTSARDPDQAITVVDSGTKLIGVQQPNILQYTMSTPYSIASVSLTTITPVDANAPFTAFKTVHMSADGVYLFAVEYDPPTNWQLHRATLSTPYDITSATWDQEAAGAGTTEPFAVRLSPSGAYLYEVVNGEIRMWDLPKYWDITSVDMTSPDRTRNYNIQDNLLSGAPGDLIWSDSGNEAFVKTGTYGAVRLYRCTTPWDPTDVTYIQEVDFASGISAYNFGTASGLWMEADQGKIWCTGQDTFNNQCFVYEYTINQG